ncbi:chemotaxis protein histidine kinase CheA [Bradyrhizobium sp. JR4.1]
MQAGPGLGSPVRRSDVWIASDCARSSARTCATRSAWIAPTVLTVISVLTIPVLAQQPNRSAIDAPVIATHLRGATGSGGWRAARPKQSADTTLLKLAQATISNTERSRQALAAEQERIQALAADLRTCRREQDTVLGLLQHAREQWTSIAEASENETDKLQKSLREERLHTERLERELTKARNDLEVQARLSREIGAEAREPEHPAQSDPSERQQAVEREKDRANRLEQTLTAAHHDLETQSAEITRQAAEISAKEAAEAQVQASLRQEHDRTKQLEETLATTRIELDNRSQQIAKVIEETAQANRTAENTSAKLKLSLREEHERADALAQDLSQVRSKLFAYEAQAAANDDRAEQLKKQLGRECHQSSPDEQELAAARPKVGPWLPAGVSGEGGAGNSPTRELLRTLLPASPQRPPEQSPRELVVIAAEPKTPSAVLGNEHAAELVRLIARATGLLRQGDIGAARVVLERAAELGSAPASFALAETYDPSLLAKWGASGTRGDTSKARELYARAAAGGVKEARERFDALGH